MLIQTFVLLYTTPKMVNIAFNLRDWIICWIVFSRYLVCLENSNSECKHLFSVNDNMNNRIFFTNIISTFNCSSLWYFVDDYIFPIMYETQALMSSLVTLHDSKSLSMRRYNNPISFFDILGELVSNLNLWLKPECDVWPGIDISLMMCEQLFVSFHVTIGIYFPLSMSR